MVETIDKWIDALLTFTSLGGMWILLITVPLAIIQGLLGLFTFATLIMLHISALGLVNGIIASWISGTIAAIAVFWVARSLFADWFNRKWKKRMTRYEKWQRHIEKYGLWAIILLRTIPIMPNNLVSFMASISPVKMIPYVWSSVIGNISHIWLFAIISSSLLVPDTDISLLIGSYVLFCLALLTVFFIKEYRNPKRKVKDNNEFTM